MFFTDEETKEHAANDKGKIDNIGKPGHDIVKKNCINNNNNKVTRIQSKNPLYVHILL